MVAGATSIEILWRRRSKGWGGGLGWGGGGGGRGGGGLGGSVGQGGIVGGWGRENRLWVEIFVYGVGGGHVLRLKKIFISWGKFFSVLPLAAGLNKDICRRDIEKKDSRHFPPLHYPRNPSSLALLCSLKRRTPHLSTLP